MTCHALEKKLVGPAFSDVAAKYRGQANASDLLAASIKTGSKGKWGAMAMPPNPRINEGDVRTLTDWILAQ